jgi:hypothetical protein
VTGRFYHRTSRKAAEAILNEGGFRDREGTYLTGRAWQGVWLSNVPLDANDGAEGDVLLEVRIAARLVRPYEWVERGKPYREFLVPAALVNAQGTVRRVE